MGEMKNRKIIDKSRRVATVVRNFSTINRIIPLKLQSDSQLEC